MALCQVHWSSQTLQKQVGMYVIVPEAGKGPFATFYLLHGLSDDYTIWHRRTRIEWYVRDWPLIVVMPDGFRGFCTNNNEGPDYARYLTEDLVEFVERTFPAKRSRAGRCVGGLSMGGYGALRLALGRPDLYASVNSHSGAVLHGAKNYSKPEQIEFRRIFGARPAGSGHDLLALAEKAKRAGRLPAIRIDCGTGDFLIGDNRKFHRRLERIGVPHEYEEFSGVHNWDFWDTHVQRALAFHARHLRLTVPGA